MSVSSKSWFEQLEKEAILADLEEPIDGTSFPRSSLKIIDETLAFELCRDGEREAEDAINYFELNKPTGFSIFDMEKEDELDELVEKCYKSDFEVNYLLSKICGRKKKKTTFVALERVTRSKKYC